MILVTGASGFAGRHLLSQLSGEPIVAWTRSGPPMPAGSPDLSWRTVDLLDRTAVEQGITSAAPRIVYHLAGAPHAGASFDDPMLPLSINALGTHYLLSAIANNAPDARVVVVSSALIYEPALTPLSESSPLVPQSPYGLSKLAQDRLATLAASADGLATVVARPFNHTGPGQDPSFAVPAFARQIARIEAGLEEPVLRVGNLDAERDVSDVRDVTQAYALIGDRGRPGEAYNISQGEAWRIGDLLDGLLRRARARVIVEFDPARLRPSDQPRLVGDSSKLRALGWTPRIPLDTTLDDVLAYWRERTA